MGVVHDGDGLVTLVRNHELKGFDGPIGDPGTAWDQTSGGTTTLVFDSRRESLVESRISLNGTLNNCAGGVTPWGTWLSCEEAPYSPEYAHFGIERRQYLWGTANARKRHGYVFEVRPQGEPDPQPIVDMGQFYHEAAATDPGSGVIYMTEDRAPHAGFYRFIPDIPGQLAAGGRLQMMRVPGRASLIEDVSPGERLPVEWVNIDKPGRGHNPDSHDGKGVVTQGMQAGGSAFVALEGCTWDAGQVYFTSKSGGPYRAGCVFGLDVSAQELDLLFVARDRNGFSGPDNIDISPRGSLVICEDRLGRHLKSQYLAGLSPAGEFFEFCRTNPALRGVHAGHRLDSTVRVSEWAGVCFSGDGQWMFANIYAPGITCAITGPWVEGLI
jgi:hypothetical protein